MKHKNSYSDIAKFGRELLNISNVNLGLPLISEYAKGIMEADRCSMYIHNKKLNLLWTTLSDGVEKIIVNVNQGIVGQTVRNKESIICNDPYSDYRFNPEIDHKTGYITRDIISVPIFDSSHEVLGVMQLLNSLDGNGFDSDDLKFAVFFAHYVSGYLELSALMNDEITLLELNDKS